MIQIILFLAFIIPAILFVLTQQNTLEIIKIENRLMKPGQVWLQFIPVLNFIWPFFVVSQISGSIQNEIVASQQDDSILGPIEELRSSNRPTLIIGITYCILYNIGILINFFARVNGQLLPVTSLIFLAGMIFWIIYWVQLSSYKRKISNQHL